MNDEDGDYPPCPEATDSVLVTASDLDLTLGITEDNPADSWEIVPLDDARASLFALNIGVGVELRQIVRLPFKLAVTLAD